MRGTPECPYYSADEAGLIPTYAGNTSYWGLPGHLTEAHPHVCGEHSGIGFKKRSRLGSSPRMRGTLNRGKNQIFFAGLIPTYAGNTNRRFRRLVRRGLIPTYAGNTSPASVRATSRRAHPHVCGEHVPVTVGSPFPMGSSPRMRGTRRRPHPRRRGMGLIPTYAGNTNGWGRSLVRGRAHPHVCGEHRYDASIAAPLEGSSPRMRGTRGDDIRVMIPGGLIPTYAGNTPLTKAHPEDAGAHPHVCGEHAAELAATALTQGSSPRMRGTRYKLRRMRSWAGLIPTYAGNTHLDAFERADAGAHPHVCGEHDNLRDVRVRKLGSSPRMRGTPHYPTHRTQGLGLIPTYAGNTLMH